MLATQPLAVFASAAPECLEDDAWRLSCSNDLAEKAILAHHGVLLQKLQGQLVAAWGLPPVAGTFSNELRSAQDAAGSILRETRRTDVSLYAEPSCRKPAPLSVSVAVDWSILNVGFERAAQRLEVLSPAIGRSISTAIASAHLDIESKHDLATVREYELVFDALARVDRLGPGSDLVRIGAVVGELPETSILAALLGRTQAAVQRELKRLVDIKIMDVLDTDHGIVWRVAGAALAAAVLSSILVTDRRRLHASIGALLQRRKAHDPLKIARQVAVHQSEGGDPRSAFAWWHRGAQAAILSSDPTTAVEYLSAAAELASTHPEITSVDEQVATLRLLAAQLGTVRGNAAPEVTEVYDRCLELIRSSPGDGQQPLFDLVWGLQASCLVRGRVTSALDLSRRLVALAEERDDKECLIAAWRLQALGKLLAGRLRDARMLFEQTLTSYRHDQHAQLRFRFASDQRAIALAGLAWTEAVAGRGQRFEDLQREALQVSDELAHAHTTAHVRGVIAVAAQLKGDWKLAESNASVTLRIANEHGMTYWRSWADIVLGRTVAQSDPERGAAIIGDAIARYIATGAGQALPYAYLMKSEAELLADRWQAAVESSIAALNASRHGGVSLYRPLATLQLARCRLHRGDATSRLYPMLRRAYISASSMGADLFATRVAGELLNLEFGGPLKMAAAKHALRASPR